MYLLRPFSRRRPSGEDDQKREQLASLVVGALGLGTGKHEGDVAAEIFSELGLDLAKIDHGIPQSAPDRAAKLRSKAAAELARSAPTMAAIVAAVVRAGGLLVAMVEEVYQFLAEHSATTGGTSESFRVAATELEGAELTLSPAFFEETRRLIRQVVIAPVGTVDIEALATFLGLDNGVPYGRWPPQDPSTGFPLPAGVLQVRSVAARLRGLESGESGWAEAAQLARATDSAAARLVGAAEQLVSGFDANLELLVAGAPASVDLVSYLIEHAYAAEIHDWWYDTCGGEVRRYLSDGFLGSGALLRSGAILDPHEVGLRQGSVVVSPVAEPRFGSPIGELSAWCAMFREGLHPEPGASDLEELVASPAVCLAWLGQLRAACEEALDWLATDVVTVSGESRTTRLIEEVEQLLNLPLWKQRELLYEIWLLCATVRACEQDGWQTWLSGLDPVSNTWLLPRSRAAEPVAYLARPTSAPGSVPRLGIWREPLRHTRGGDPLTPDITISTTGPPPRDLVVVEAKDRVNMAAGKALEAGRRYASGLEPRLTWVGNHCDFRGWNAPEHNHGDPWHPIHLAARLRPGSVPEAFATTITAAIRPIEPL